MFQKVEPLTLPDLRAFNDGSCPSLICVQDCEDTDRLAALWFNYRQALALHKWLTAALGIGKDAERYNYVRAHAMPLSYGAFDEYIDMKIAALAAAPASHE